jgi:hypothetical protein
MAVVVEIIDFGEDLPELHGSSCTHFEIEYKHIKFDLLPKSIPSVLSELVISV